MTQKSYPWPGVAPGSGADAGRYTNEEWTAVWACIARAGGIIVDTIPLRTLAALANLGVFYSAGNRLAVTAPGAANTVQIDTGASLVEGQFHFNDTAITFGSVPDNKTNDLIVVRRNYTAIDWSPNDSVDATEDVPAYTSRVTRLDIGGGDAFTQDTTRATYWDIPLADITTDGVGAVTINSDDREWVDARQYKKWVCPMMGWNDDTNTEVSLQANETGAGEFIASINLTDNAKVYALGQWGVDENYLANLTITPVATRRSGDIFGQGLLYAGLCGERIYVGDPETATSGVFDAQTFDGQVGGAGTSHKYVCITGHAAAFTTEDLDNRIVQIQYIRDSNDAQDTIGADVWFLGWIVEYLGWR